MRCPIRGPHNGLDVPYGGPSSGKGCRYEVPSMPPLHHSVPKGDALSSRESGMQCCEKT